VEREEQTGDIEMAWRDVPRGLYRGEWDAKKGEINRLDYCGSSRVSSVNKEGSIVQRMGGV
jgi:hypothetical protein